MTHAAGSVRTGYPCHVCDPALSAVEWSVLPDGARCRYEIAGYVCLSGTCVIEAVGVTDSATQLCTDGSNIVDCPMDPTSPYARQDGDMVIPTPRYTLEVSGDRTVIDELTGLRWYAALPPPERTWSDAVAWCEWLDFAGYTDWRLPTPVELVSIMDFGRPSPWVNSYLFPEPASSSYIYWTLAGGRTSAEAWAVSLVNGPQSLDKAGARYPRCVREDAVVPPPTRYTVDTGTVTDNATALVWEEPPMTVTVAWAGAFSHCETLAPSNTWRVPTLKELFTLQRFAAGAGATIDELVFPGAASALWWSSTTMDYWPSGAWLVAYDNATAVIGAGNTYGARVRCVR